MNAPSFTAPLGELVADAYVIDPICETCRESEAACLCEPDLQGTVEGLTRIVSQLSGEIAGYQQGDKEAAELAEKVIQATTLDEAQRAARVFLGLEQPF